MTLLVSPLTMSYRGGMTGSPWESRGMHPNIVSSASSDLSAYIPRLECQTNSLYAKLLTTAQSGRERSFYTTDCAHP